jgi:hypothetical protein
MDNESKDNLLQLESDRETDVSMDRVSWKKEALGGNFMPAVVKLDRKELHQDDIVDPVTENRLLHLSVHYSYYNVTRALVELYNADINIKNTHGHTPLHIICNQEFPDLYLFSYLVKNDLINIDMADITNVTPLFYTIMSRFHLGMLALIHNRADVRHVDNFGNTIFYMALANDNKFAVKFLLHHFDYFSLNHSYYKDKVSLSDLFISCKDSSLLKHVLKYHEGNININSVISCLKPKEKFDYYNVFNYELLNTFYSYKTRDFLGVFKILKGYRYKLYNLKFLANMLVQNTAKWVKMIMILLYFIFLTFVYIQYEVDYVGDSDLLSFDSILVIFRLMNTVGIFAFFVMWALKLINVTYDNQYSLSVPEHKRDNVIGQLYEAMENNPLDIFFVDEICEICLIKKQKSTNHCHLCNRCVHDFYFHSRLLNQCFNKQNIKYYFLFINSLAGLHLSLLYFMATNMEVEFTSSTVNNIAVFFTNMSLSQWPVFLYLLITSIFMLQTALAIFLCMGIGFTYYNAYRFHKKSLGNISRRQNVYINSPESNSMTMTGFVKNLFK